MGEKIPIEPFRVTKAEQRIIDRIMEGNVRQREKLQIPNWLALPVAMLIVAYVYATVLSRSFGTWMQRQVEVIGPYIGKYHQLRDEHGTTALIVALGILSAWTLFESDRRDRLLKRYILRNRALERALNQRGGP